MRKLSLCSSYAFYKIETYNFGTLYAKLTFDSKSDCEDTLHDVYVTIYACASSRGLILEIVLPLAASSFIRSLLRGLLVDAHVQHT